MAPPVCPVYIEILDLMMFSAVLLSIHFAVIMLDGIKSFCKKCF